MHMLPGGKEGHFDGSSSSSLANDADWQRAFCAPTPVGRTFYLRGETHTLASCLREQLEATTSAAHTFASCNLLHPLDDHLVVQAPEEADVRRALLAVKELIGAVRGTLRERSPP